jgi:hypothetical protein
MGGYRTPGGHFDKDGNLLPDAPIPDMSGWARKQYPGGQGGPVPPWMTGGASLGSLGGGKMVYSPSAHESSWVTDEQLANSQRMQDEYARTGVMPQMPKMPSFGASLSALGVNGGNVAPKPSGGLAGAIFNKYPDLFGKR